MGAASDCDSPTGSSPRLTEASRGSTTAEARVQRSGRGDPTRQTPAGGVLWVAYDGSGCGSAERTRRSNRVEWPYAAERGLPWGQSRQPPPTAAGCDTTGRTCTETIDLLNVRNVAREHRREHGTRREPSPTQLRRGRVSVFEVEPPASRSDRSVAKGVSRPERNPTWYDTTGILRPTDSQMNKYR